MATKRADFNAVQIRVTDEELARLDRWVEKQQKGRPGSSGVTRSSLVRDLVMAEIERRETAILLAKDAGDLLSAVNTFADGKHEPSAFLPSDVAATHALVEQAVKVLRWVSNARLNSSVRAKNFVSEYDFGRKTARTDEPVNAPLDLATQRAYIALLDIQIALAEFVSEVRLIYGDDLRAPHRGAHVNAYKRRPRNKGQRMLPHRSSGPQARCP